MLVFKQVIKLYLCVFFCNYTQKNMIKTMNLKEMRRYICIQDYFIDELTNLEVESK